MNAFVKQTAHGNNGLNIGQLKLQVSTEFFYSIYEVTPKIFLNGKMIYVSCFSVDKEIRQYLHRQTRRKIIHPPPFRLRKEMQKQKQ